MDESNEFICEVRAGIADAETISLFFPLLRRALIVDTRHDESTSHLVKVVPQVQSMEERIASIEAIRPQLGKVRSILGIPWLRSVQALDEQAITDSLADRLWKSGMSRSFAQRAIADAVQQLWSIERLAYTRMIRGEGFATIWVANS